jgi:hypothetical protein
VFPLALPIERLFYCANGKACNNNLKGGSRGLEIVNWSYPLYVPK